MGYRLATLNEVKKAYLEGAQWYNMGWSDGQLGLYVLQPRFVRRYPSAGTIGVNGGYFRNPNLRMGINCYGVKPKPDPARIEYSYNELRKEIEGSDSTNNNHQQSIDRIKNRYKNMVKDGEILISPWNDKKWSVDSEKQSKYHMYPEGRKKKIESISSPSQTDSKVHNNPKVNKNSTHSSSTSDNISYSEAVSSLS